MDYNHDLLYGGLVLIGIVLMFVTVLRPPSKGNMP